MYLLQKSRAGRARPPSNGGNNRFFFFFFLSSVIFVELLSIHT